LSFLRWLATSPKMLLSVPKRKGLWFGKVMWC